MFLFLFCELESQLPSYPLTTTFLVLLFTFREVFYPYRTRFVTIFFRASPLTDIR